MDTFFQNLLLWIAPFVYVLIIAYSIRVALKKSQTNARHRRAINPLIISILAGISVCPVVASIMQPITKFNSIETIPITCFTLIVGFAFGIIYLWAANAVFSDSLMTSLFVLGSIGGSVICLYFYVFHTYTQLFLSTSAWGFLFGMLFRAALLNIKKGENS